MDVVKNLIQFKKLNLDYLEDNLKRSFLDLNKFGKLDYEKLM